MKYEHSKTGWKFELGTLTQSKAEILMEAITAEHKTGLHRNHVIVDTAIESGWLDGDWDVPNMEPAQVFWMAQKITDAYMQGITIPKE